MEMKVKMNTVALAVAMSISTTTIAQEINREEYQALVDRLIALEEENQNLRRIENTTVSVSPANQSAMSHEHESLVGTNAEYNYKVLDHAENTNTNQLYQLQALRDGQIKNKLTLGGQVTALVNTQRANEDTKFGWLMRHPTSSNQIGKNASEAVVHSANLNMTAKLSDDFTAYIEMLYNPEQNFASGSTITGLPRNNVNMRRAYILWGNLEKSPFYASVGKMDIPFGLNDTVSPFTNSTSWHSFGGLAYGGTLGYATDDLHMRVMAIQGGAQFRNANTPVGDTNVPSKLNNYAVDVNYNFNMADDSSLKIGASYQYGTAYCQGYVDTPETAHSTFPAFIPGVTVNTASQGVKHFNSCADNNPGAAVYSRYENNKLLVIAEYAKTLDQWAGTFNPYIPQFKAEENTTFTLGARYSASVGLEQDMDFSAEFSRFEAGASGSPWEKQDQLVLGASYFLTPSVNLFAEAIAVDGWVPLNFLSGGNPGSKVGTSWSSQSSKTKVLTFGIQAGF
jgi:hypothetical protein